MKVTINDVAKHAGVSIKTVSRVTNKEPSVRQVTIDKVTAAINELNYQPNVAARNLASTSAYVIGFIYDNSNAYYVIDMQNGILSSCKDKGFELLINPCDSRCENICEQLTSMVKQARLAGLVLTPPLSEDPKILAALDAISANYVRIVAGEENDGNETLTVLVNDKVGAISITQHLIELGHRHIGFISGDEDHESTKARFNGFKDALSEHKMTLNEDWVIQGQYSFESGVRCANSLLALENKPTAIVACNDEIAAGALFAARLAGLDIPKDLSIVGFEDSPFSRQTWPKLTTVHQPNIEIAKVATDLLIEKHRKVLTQSTKIFTPSPVIRDSTYSPT
ncbi:LacI family DNA-binding transcriptional regulator [Shewanella intestini]|uniref:LacI family transcriptional regulator n=1 Tax=Shewanella intestini TaxID=2017544 RepID=A0ABS5HY56_9GAMM|nr:MULTISPECIES: LacI family DNA-binding transcriptional regulator [Shewanella]MBR9726701.1 LacI family transcriptional regulator [Shewanella intestini]MRG34733.1 LacI family DNA-binding transcriptional regulator [Shewanella sp. XMDDZSB0408]